MSIGKIKDIRLLSLPALRVVENASVKIGHGVVIVIVDEKRDAVVLKGSLGVRLTQYTSSMIKRLVM